MTLSHSWERVPEGRERAAVYQALSPNPSPINGRGELESSLE